MANVFDYINWRGDLSLKIDEFNDVDALILSRLSYLPFDNIVSKNIHNQISIYNATDLYFEQKENRQKPFWEGDLELLKYVANADRFSTLRLSGYENIVDNDTQMQFSAVIIELQKDRYFISFRGTDNSLVGWQEDCNMYYMFPLPSQIKAAQFVENAAKQLSGTFILGGHSKGGNLAVYSAAFCSPEVQKRIEKVYNHDGPGFTSKVLETKEFKAIINKVNTFVPQSSIFGMMFEHSDDYSIIKSNQKGFLQHDIYSWEVRRTNLVYLNTMTNTSRFFDHTINDFVAELSVEDRKALIEAVFKLLESTNASTFDDIGNNFSESYSEIFKSIGTMDGKMRSKIVKTLFMLIKCAAENFSDINPINSVKHRFRLPFK